MILPNKHLDLPSSLLGVGAHVLKCMERPGTVTTVWEEFQRGESGVPFHRFVLALDFLYAIDAIGFSSGLLCRRER